MDLRWFTPAYLDRGLPWKSQLGVCFRRWTCPKMGTFQSLASTAKSVGWYVQVFPYASGSYRWIWSKSLWTNYVYVWSGIGSKSSPVLALRIHWQLQASHSRHSPTPSHRMSRCTAFCNAPDWRKAMCFQWGRGSGEWFQPGVNTIREWEGVAPCCTYRLWETHGLCNQFIVNPIFVRQDFSNKLPSVDHGWYSYGGFLKWVYPKPGVSILSHSHSLILDDWG